MANGNDPSAEDMSDILSQPMLNCTDSLEHQFFTWCDWWPNGPMNLGFNGVTLVQKLGQYEIGTKFDFADFDGETSTLSFSTADGLLNNGQGKTKEVARFRLVLTVEPLPLIAG